MVRSPRGRQSQSIETVMKMTDTVNINDHAKADGNRFGRTTKARVGKRWKPAQEQIVLCVALLMFLAFSITLPGFLTAGNIVALAQGVALLGILALGAMVVVIGRGLDLAQIAAMASGAIVTIVSIRTGLPAPMVIILGLAASLSIGLLNGFLVAYAEIPSIFATLSTNILVYGLLRYFVQGGEAMAYLPAEAAWLKSLGNLKFFDLPISVVMFFVLAAIIHFVMSRTVFGLFVYAHGSNPETARLSGIAVRPLTIAEYVVSAFIGYLAGMLYISTLGTISADVMTSQLIFNVILIVILGGVSLTGGRGNVLSIVAGTILVGTLLNGLTILNVSVDLANVARGLVLLAAIILDNRLHPRNEETARQGE